MKRFYFLLLAAGWLGSSLSGCSNHAVTPVTKSESYSFKEAISRGDVVFFNEGYNMDGFDQFLTNLADKKADSIRVTGFTDEGDPIFKDLKFDGDVISYTYDNSNDAFGGQNKGIRTDICSSVTNKKNSQGEFTYTITGCTKNDDQISYFLII
jgi:hypothetical protein